MAFEMRRYSTAGIAMASAGVIALSPLTIPSPDLHLPAPTTVASTRTVDLTAFVNPLAVWGDVLTTTVTDIGNLGQAFAADPFPLAKQVIANQIRYANQILTIGQGMAKGLINWANTVPDSLRTMAQQLAAGQVSDAVMSGWGIFVNGVVGVMFPVLGLDIPQQVTQNVANVVKALTPVIAQVGFAVLNTMYQATDAFGDIAQNFYNAAKVGDIVTAASELINAPANLTGAVLNGWGEGSKGVYGIFGSFGVVAAVMQGFKTIADAIKPPAPEAPVAATVDGPAAVPASASKALASETTAAVDTGATVKEAPEKAKAPVAKADPKTVTPVATEAETPKTEQVKVAEPVKTEPVKVEVSTPAADPVSAEPVKVEATKPVHNDTATSEAGTKAAGATSSDADSAGKSDKSDKPAGKGQKAEKAPKAQKTPKAPKVAKQPKKASSTQQSANAG
ncbi:MULTISPECIES: hypothetical protein [unclassified Mycobacterium]|uniref:hypothetical protein n=1 Tax=unclassified Mycobacterium TaxID=2642494 RepID=UPI00048A7688|nr:MULTISPECIES: hypothetical protein [unclassified Mycobacterium]SEB27082.1 hypothetical protein SAMN04488580_12521 [Mycobacterium sp. 283mftsu]